MEVVVTVEGGLYNSLNALAGLSNKPVERVINEALTEWLDTTGNLVLEHISGSEGRTTDNIVPFLRQDTAIFAAL